MLLVKFILAFCALSYELLLAQILAAFLDNTVLRYCTTIGLYMFAMGLGAWASAKSDVKRPALILWQTEIAMVITAVLGLLSLFVMTGLHASTWHVAAWAYGVVMLIGFLTGLELPLMLQLAERQPKVTRGQILGFDYAGACAAAIVFTLYFYPSAGLVLSFIQVAFLNLLMAVVVAARWPEDFEDLAWPALLGGVALSLAVVPLLFFSGTLELKLLSVYLR